MLCRELGPILLAPYPRFSVVYTLVIASAQRKRNVLKTCRPTTMTAPVPDKFFGRYQLEKSENFDEFLSSKGVNWFVRQMIKLAGLTKVIGQGADAGKYNMENLTSKKNTNYQDWELGKSFEAPGLDGNQHQITFNFKDDELAEHHIRLNEPETSAETYFYTIDDNSQLVMRMENNGIVCRRWFKRVEPKEQK